MFSKHYVITLLLSLTLCNLALAEVPDEALLKKSPSGWVAADYTAEELNQPGMLCIRFNNYWCIKSPIGKPTYWNGQVSQDSRGHAQFSHPKYAARAFIKLMHTYRFKYNLHSANDIMNRYAPRTDTIGSIAGGQANPTDLYAEQIAKALNKEPNEDLNIFIDDQTLNKENAVLLLKAFAKWEITAKHAVTDKVILDGINLAGF